MSWRSARFSSRHRAGLRRSFCLREGLRIHEILPHSLRVRGAPGVGPGHRRVRGRGHDGAAPVPASGRPCGGAGHRWRRRLSRHGTVDGRPQDRRDPSPGHRRPPHPGVSHAVRHAPRRRCRLAQEDLPEGHVAADPQGQRGDPRRTPPSRASRSDDREWRPPFPERCRLARLHGLALRGRERRHRRTSSSGRCRAGCPGPGPVGHRIGLGNIAIRAQRQCCLRPEGLEHPRRPRAPQPRPGQDPRGPVIPRSQDGGGCLCIQSQPSHRLCGVPRPARQAEGERRATRQSRPRHHARPLCRGTRVHQPRSHGDRPEPPDRFRHLAALTA